MQVLSLEDPASVVVLLFLFYNGVSLNESYLVELVFVLVYWRFTPMERCSISVISPTFSYSGKRLGHLALFSISLVDLYEIFNTF